MEVIKLTVNPRPIRLDMRLDYFPSFDLQCVPLAPRSAENGLVLEREVQRGGEDARRVSEETDLDRDLAKTWSETSEAFEKREEGAGRCERGKREKSYATFPCRIQRGRPGFHDEGVVDRDDEDFAGRGELGVLDVAGNVGGGAGGAWRLERQIYVLLQEA